MKKFLIVGNMNAITYKEVFPYIKDNKMWMGYIFNKTLEFSTPYNESGKGKVPAISWFTNLKKNPVEPLKLSKQYNSTDYPKYDNYNAINCNKVKDIPIDYKEAMGVPITVLQYLNSDGYITFDTEQYQIVKFRKGNDGKDLSINGKDKYTRVVIKKKLKFKVLGITDRQNTYGYRTKKYTIEDSEKYNDLNARSVIIINGEYKQQYARVIIKRV